MTDVTTGADGAPPTDDVGLLARVIDGLNRAEDKVEELLENPVLPAEAKAALEAVEEILETATDALERLEAIRDRGAIRGAFRQLVERIRAKKAGRQAAKAAE